MGNSFQTMAVSTGDSELDQMVQNWLQWNPPGTPDYLFISNLVQSKDYASLNKLMKKRNTFGTAGIRGKMGPG